MLFTFISLFALPGKFAMGFALFALPDGELAMGFALFALFALPGELRWDLHYLHYLHYLVNLRWDLHYFYITIIPH